MLVGWLLFIFFEKMSRIRIDQKVIEKAKEDVKSAEEEEIEARGILGEIELRRNTILWAHQQAGYEYHTTTSASGLYMTGYGSSRRHTDRCNSHMDRKQAIDQKFRENMVDVQGDIQWGQDKLDAAVEKLRKTKEALQRAERGF